MVIMTKEEINNIFSTYSINQMFEIVDEMDKGEWNRENSKCKELYHKIYSKDSIFNTTYMTRLSFLIALDLGKRLKAEKRKNICKNILNN